MNKSGGVEMVRHISIILAVLIAMAMPVSGVAAEGDSYIVLGDVNGDGVLTSTDLTRLMKLLAGMDVEIAEGTADVNSDGDISAADLTRLMKYIAHGETMEKKCKLIVFGKEIETKNDPYINFEHSYGVLPLTETFLAAGGTVEWTSETTATLRYENKEFDLDLKEKVLIDKSKSSNILLLAPGTYLFDRSAAFEVVDGELMAETSYFVWLFSKEMDCVIHIEYDDLAIAVKKRNPNRIG